MKDVKARAQNHDFTAFAALDSIDAIMDRIETMVRTGRRMTWVHRWVDGAEAPQVKPSLTLDTRALGGGLDRRRSEDHAGITVLLHPGITSFGIGAHASSGTEEDVRARYHSDKPQDCHLVQIEGFGQGRDDRIVHTWYNEYGVGQQTVIAFETVDPDERAEADAVVLDALADAAAAAAGRVWDETALRDAAKALRYHWRTLPEHLEQSA